MKKYINFVVRLLLPLSVVIALPSCSDPSSAGRNDNTINGDSDSGGDADADSDADADTDSDADGDADADTDNDADADTDNDADADADSDADADTDNDADADADSDADADTDSDADADADSDADADTDSDADADTDNDADADTDNDADADTDSDADTDTDNDADADTDSDADTDTDSDTDTDTDSDGDPYINSDAWVNADNNPYGIQGNWYAFSDGNSSSQSGNPYADGKYCIAGNLTGASGDWGAGIGLDLNGDSGGGKLAYLYKDKGVAGFRIKLSGNSPGRLRIQFIVNEPQSDNQPFLEAHLNTTMTYPVAWAQIPVSWDDVPEAGTEVETELYAVQVFIEGDYAGPFEVCIEDFDPVGADGLAIEAQPPNAGYFGARTIDDAILQREYELWKSLRFHDCSDGSACVPRDEGDCASEGIGYGMLIAVGFDDQDAFGKLWKYYTNHKGTGGLMAWRTNICDTGPPIDSNPATDGDVDVAMALIQAGCKWGGNYDDDAKGVITILQSSYITQGCSGGTVLKPGNFGGCDQTDPSYFAPGYFKIFAEKTENQIWNTLVNDSYNMVFANQQKQGGGLVSDWCRSDGTAIASLADGSIGYGPDASRVPWRIATDYAWNQDERAVTFLNNFSNYVDSNGGVERLFDPNSNYRGGSAFSGIHQDSVKAQSYADAWLMTSVDDETYFPGTLRALYLLLASNRFPKGCN